MKKLIWLFILGMGFVIIKDLASESLGKATIITAGDLAANIEHISILDARGSDSFAMGHIPGAHLVDWGEWALEYPCFSNFLFGSPSKWGRVLAPSDKVQEQLQMLGLSNNKKIVVIGDSNGEGEEGRVAWNLLYWGAQDVALLDGGFEAWKRDSSRKIETGIPDKTIAKGNFTIEIRPQRLVQIEEVLSNLSSKDRILLDARSPDEFEGETTQWGQQRGGHIPGAVLVPFKSLYEKDGTYSKLQTLKELISAYGKKPPITYCTAGVRGALLAVLYEIRTGKIAANYAGSVYEWSAHEELPLIKGHFCRCHHINCPWKYARSIYGWPADEEPPLPKGHICECGHLDCSGNG